MARLSIPRRHYGGLATLRRLPEEAFEELLGVLGKTPPIADTKRLCEAVTPQIRSLPPQEAEELLTAICGLYWIRRVLDLPVDQLASELVVAMKEAGSDELAVPENEVPRFQERIGRLLTFESLDSASKAAELALDRPQVFCTAKTVTDLRPVFGADPAQRPVGAVVTHTLRLEYHKGKGGDVEVLHIAMDSHDIAKLKDVLEQAEAESRSLRSFLMEARMSDFGSA